MSRSSGSLGDFSLFDLAIAPLALNTLYLSDPKLIVLAEQGEILDQA
ncbi:MAG: hypothetical protein F6J87_17160 [Spirulina sp. SIO3F2]|nr:hypothetical protein [Spirulina sp. SIO3F2]